MLKTLNLKLYAVLAALLLILFLIPHFAFAQTQSDRKTTTLPSNQTVDGDYFAANHNLNLDGTVNGDAFVVGGNVNMDGTINGDLLVVGGNVEIKGKVTGSVRAAGGQVSLSGNIGKNVSVAGGNISVTNGAKVGGNLDVMGGNLSVSSPIAGGVNAMVGQLNLSNGSVVNKDLTYWSNNQAQISQQASVSGRISQYSPPVRDYPSPLGVFRRGFILFALLSLLSSLVLGILMIAFLPNYSQSVADVIKKRPGASFLTGLLAILVMPVLLIGLVITLLGIPLAVLVFAIIVMFFYLSRIFAALFLGQLILGRSDKASPYLALVLGLLLLGIITYIPLVGGLVLLVLGLMGVGAVLLEKKQLYTRLRSQNIL